MHKHIRISLKLVDLLAGTAIVAICAAYWKTDLLTGWIASTIGCSAMAYFINHVRAKPPLFATMLLAIPVITVVAFLTAFIFDIPLDLKQPPSYSTEEQTAHALMLSILSLLFCTATILTLGMFRRSMINFGFTGPFGISEGNAKSDHTVPNALNAVQQFDPAKERQLS